ncbi:hypothetical protein [Streptomyces sp. NPDC057909]|uniref:hypothetical protein n=1 Tax=Streptomyces sp. NPDC057909 TaxID=3346277 RepID=UPI0036F1605B
MDLFDEKMRAIMTDHDTVDPYGSHAQDELTSRIARARHGRTTLGTAATALVAVTAIGALAFLPDMGHHQTNRPDTAAAQNSLGRITTAAYTLQRQDNDVVTLTMTDNPIKNPDLDRLREDLARLGVPGHVYAGDPHCTSAPLKRGSTSITTAMGDALEFSFKGSDWMMSVHRDRLAAGQSVLLYFPSLNTDRSQPLIEVHAGLLKGKAPACLPVQPLKSSVYTNGKPVTETTYVLGHEGG